MRRVVVTGLGAVSPLGCEKDTIWNRMTSGESGIGRIENFDASSLTSQIAGEVKEFDCSKYIDKKKQRRMDLFCHYGIAAAMESATDSGLNLEEEDPTRVGVIIGSGIGGLRTLETQYEILVNKGPSRCSPFMIPQMISNMVAGNAAIELNAQGPNYGVVSACASAVHSIGDAMRIMQRGEADIMFAGGSEAAVCMLGVAGFCALKALCATNNDDPTTGSKPFDANRSGFVIAEGAAVLVLEELEHAKARGADIYCELSGFGMTCDAFHMTAPAEGGVGAARAMSNALKDAELTPEDIDYVNAHGTSTTLNDRAETAAIKTSLGEDRAKQIMVSSTKSMTGHLLGAAGGIESLACAMAIKHGVVPPTINYTTPDPECDLDYTPNTARETKVRACMNNSLGFGGHNASLVFKAMD